MALRIVLTDGDGVQGLSATFGALIQTNIVQTAADAAAAAQSALNAAASATNSATSAAASATSASSAATQASNAAGSASAAAGSATAAGNSATTAAILANAASGSATAASTSATNAANSATAAGTSATNASNSATAAANSASAAAATLANALVKNADNTVTSASPALIFKDSTQTGGVGVFRMRDISGVWNFQRNTAAAGDFSSLTTPLQFGVDDVLRTSQRPLFNGNTPWDNGNVSVATLMGRNRIINGDARVTQRAAVSVTGSLVYGQCDRWNGFIFGSAGGAFTLDQTQASLPSGQTRFWVRQLCTTPPSSLASGNGWNGISQTIEGNCCHDLIGQQITVSFWFLCNVSGTYTVSLRDSPNNNSYVTTFSAVAGTPTKVSFTTPVLPSSLSLPTSVAPGLVLNIGALNTGTFMCPTGSLNSWQVANYISAQGATNWAATANNYIEATEIQIIAGNIDAQFEHRPIGTELLLCQRYYQQMLIYFQSYQNTGGTIAQAWNYPVPMRGSPGIVLVNPTYSNGSSLSISSVSNIYCVAQFITAATGPSAASSNITLNAEL